MKPQQNEIAANECSVGKQWLMVTASCAEVCTCKPALHVDGIVHDLCFQFYSQGQLVYDMLDVLKHTWTARSGWKVAHINCMKVVPTSSPLQTVSLSFPAPLLIF